ncbi:sugar phosphate nucleotidyltransferase [Bradyrhizobium sp. Ec3.3]|uniref:phosphocholine cytidylyltransferase family protein n=1 Tax=Bradyrhizobium sp. Ec3.3 TaxID=189753 RepID=UPI00041D877C|nr:phosphocholine cytidylyltransferase family protein [Bradyrhizobium sp. Ec3.3]
MPDAPSKAIILAAGLGSRLRPLTETRPKPLIEVHGRPILHNALGNLAALGVSETTIVVGYRKDDITASCGDAYGSMKITYVDSSEFERTGSAYSLWLARDTLMNGDIFLLEGDVIFESSALSRLLDHEGDVAAIDIFDEMMTGSAVILSEDGYVREFRLNQSSADLSTEPLYKTINLFRFGKYTLKEHLVPRLDALFAAGGSKAYVEQVLACLIADGELRIKGALCDDLRWFEIDSTADLRVAERIFRSQRSGLSGTSNRGAATSNKV